MPYTSKKEFKKMTIRELDESIDKLPYNWMKAVCYQSIKNVRPEYLSRHMRKKGKEG